MERLDQDRPQVGVFIKTPAVQMVEIAGRAKLDFVVLDAEHAPLDRRDVDIMLVAARAAGLKTLVRCPDTQPHWIASYLDMGADGVLAPKVKDIDEVHRCVAASRFINGTRGASPSTRSGDYGGLSLSEFVNTSDARAEVWVQIETEEALRDVDVIAACDGVHCLFIGPADLALALGCDTPSAPAVRQAIDAIIQTCLQRGKAIGAFASSTEQAAALAAKGVRWLVVGSDQSAMRTEFSRVRSALHPSMTERS